MHRFKQQVRYLSVSQWRHELDELFLRILRLQVPGSEFAKLTHRIAEIFPRTPIHQFEMVAVSAENINFTDGIFDNSSEPFVERSRGQSFQFGSCATGKQLHYFGGLFGMFKRFVVKSSKQAEHFSR